MRKNEGLMKIVVVALVVFALMSVAMPIVAAAEYECPQDVQQAYQQYIAAYNRLTSLMAEGKGDTPEAQEVYQEYAKAKACYESRLSGDSGGTSGFTTIKDWDESGDSFSFSLGEVCSGCWHEAPDSDFFIADRAEDSIIHVFDSPGIIDMGDIPLDDIKEAPASGYVEMATPIDGHSYVVRSKGKYGKFYLDETYDWKDPTEYGIEWVYQLNGTRTFGGAEAPGEPATQRQTGTGREYECPQDAGEAYQQYIAAYNKLTYLMAEGKGDTPEAQAAYEEYAAAKACYESRISGTETPPTPTPTPTLSEPATPGQTGTGGEYECPQDAGEAYQWYIAAYNKLTSLIAKGEGDLDSPATLQAYEEYKAAKACYESRISGTETPATPTPTPTPSEPATPGQTVTGGEYECPQDYRRAYQWYIAAYNKLTSLIAKGEGDLDSPAALQAYEEYKAAKACYESRASGTEPSPTPTPTPTPGPTPAGHKLVAYYPFDGDTKDYSWNGNDGTNHGATFVSGVSGKALSFDGKDDWVKVDSSKSLDTKNKITLEAWINPKNDGAAHPILEYNDGTNFGVHVWQWQHWPDLFVNFFDTRGRYLTAYGVVTTDWQHIAAVYDGTYGKLYRNGELVESWEFGALRLETSYDFYIGWRPSHGDYYFNGIIDEVKIYNYALTADEIKANYNNIKVSTSLPDVYSPKSQYGQIDPNGEITITTFHTSPKGVNNIAYTSILVKDEKNKIYIQDPYNTPNNPASLPRNHFFVYPTEKTGYTSQDLIDVGANGAVRATSTYYSTILPGTKAEVIGDTLKITLQLRLINFPAGKKYIYAHTVNVQEVDSGWKQVGEFDVTVGIATGSGTSYLEATLTHSGFDFSEGTTGESLINDGEVIYWQPGHAGTHPDYPDYSEYLWWRNIHLDDVNRASQTKDMGAVDIATVREVPAEWDKSPLIPPLLVGHTIVAKCYDGYVKFQVISVDPADESARVKYLYSPDTTFAEGTPTLQPTPEKTEFANGIATPMGFAFDPDGRLFVGNRERGEVFGPITRGDNPPPVYASGLGAVADIAFDEAGYLYACNDYTGNIYKVPPGGGEVHPFFTGSTFAGTEPDPNSLNIAPPAFSGSKAKPGDLIVMDRDYGSYAKRHIVAISPTGEVTSLAGPEELPAVPSDGDFSPDGRFYATTEAGTIFTLDADGVITEFGKFNLKSISSLSINPVNGDIFVGGADKIFKIDPHTKDIVVFAKDFGVVPWWSALSVSPDGKTLYVGDSNADAVYTISL